MSTGTMRARLNDGSGRPPRLRLMHSLWGLIGLPRGGPEWSVEEKARRVKAAGFEGIECPVDLYADAAVGKALDAHGLALALTGRFMGPDDVRAVAALARRARASYVFGRWGHAFMSDEEAAALVREGLRIMDDAGVPCFVETHRRTVTESPYRVLRLVERIPEVRFTGDFSHWIVAGNLPGEKTETLLDRLGPALDRVETLQARVSNGEQVQVDVGDGAGPHVERMVALWTEAMRRWRLRAGPGDCLPFASELGPPPYSITGLDGQEISDRWKQSLVMKDLGERTWAQAVGG